jgi:hypothetical protein
MATTYTPGKTLGRGDLDIFLTDANENPTNAAEIYFSLHYLSPGPPETEVLIGLPQRSPVNPTVGEYYAAIMVPPSATLGTYRIRWFLRQYVNSTQQQVVQEFQVTDPDSGLNTVNYSQAQTEMMSRLRMALRDHFPSRNYRFSPPEYEGDINQYNRIFGQVWEDNELLEYLLWSLDWWNMFPPMTNSVNTIDLLVNQWPSWRTVIMWGAISHACFALSMNWIHEEFSYSIGGISLDIERSSKYQSLMDSANSQFDKATEAKVNTVKLIRGLQQPKYGMGVRSSFGPAAGRGVLSPRSFMA